MRGIVADHQQIKEACFRPTGRELSLMTGKPDVMQAPGLLLSDKVLHSAARREDLVPFRLGFDVVQGNDVEVSSTQLRQDVVEFVGSVGGASRLKLDGNDDLGSFGPERRDGLAHRVCVATPVEIIQPASDGAFHVPWPQTRTAARCETQAAHLGHCGAEFYTVLHDPGVSQWGAESGPGRVCNAWG